MNQTVVSYAIIECIASCPLRFYLRLHFFIFCLDLNKSYDIHLISIFEMMKCLFHFMLFGEKFVAVSIGISVEKDLLN